MSRWSSFWSDNLPAPIKVGLRQLAFRALEIYAHFTGEKNFLPPKWLPLVGTGGFDDIGVEYKNYFIKYGQLRPTDHILDIGCGMGRMARPLTHYLDPAVGRYDGFDIDPGAIRWCQQHITPHHPNFNFQHVNVFNRNYHLASQVSAASFQFPYAEAHFDFVIATSLFTHLLPTEARNYVAETARVLKPNGRGLLTFFLLNPEAEAGLAAGRGHLNFAHPYANYRLVNPALPETAVAHAEADVLGWLAEHGLRAEQICYGNWCGREKFVNGQDFIIIQKRTA